MPDPRYLSPAARETMLRSLRVEVEAIRIAEGRPTPQEAHAHNDALQRDREMRDA
jgi:hypothetical protein